MALNLYVIDGGRYRDLLASDADAVAYWPLDEPDGEVSCHSAVSGIDPIVWTDAVEGRRAVAFDLMEYEAGYATRAGFRDPSSNYQDSGSGTLPSGAFATTGGTVSAWLFIDKSLPFDSMVAGWFGQVAGDYGGAFYVRDFSGSGGTIAALRWEVPNYPTGGASCIFPDADVPDREWFLATVTMDAANATKLYVNGVEVLSTTLAVTPFAPRAQDMLVGVLGTQESVDPDDSFAVFGFGVVNRAMSAAEVLDLYESTDITRYNVNEYLDATSLRIVDSIGSRSTCDFTLKVRSDLVDPFRPLDGAEVIVIDTDATPGDDRVFGGYIDTIDEDGEPAFDGTHEELLTLTCACVDYTELVDRHVVIADWENVVSGQVVRDIGLDYLAADGVTIPTGFVEDGPVVTRVVGSYVTAGSVLDELAGRTGMSWFIDYYRRLRWYAAGTADAPFDVVESVGVPNVHRIRRARKRTNYRNRQYVKGGTDTTDLRTESFLGDGEAKTFVVAYPVKTAPTITVAGVSKTVGVKGVDTGRQWYWSEGSTEIVQDDGDAPVAAAAVVAITYRGTFPITVVAQNTDEIELRAEREGTSGLYEHVESANDVDRSDMAIERAEGMLRRFGTVTDQGTITTSSIREPQAANLRAGMVQTVNVPRRGIVGDMLVERLTISSDAGGVTWYDYDVVSEESQGSWADFFRRLALIAGAGPATEGDLLVYVRSIGDAVVVTDTFDVPVSASYAAAIVGTAIVGFSEIGS